MFLKHRQMNNKSNIEKTRKHNNNASPLRRKSIKIQHKSISVKCERDGKFKKLKEKLNN